MYTGAGKATAPDAMKPRQSADRDRAAYSYPAQVGHDSLFGAGPGKVAHGANPEHTSGRICAGPLAAAPSNEQLLVAPIATRIRALARPNTAMLPGEDNLNPLGSLSYAKAAPPFAGGSQGYRRGAACAPMGHPLGTAWAPLGQRLGNAWATLGLRFSTAWAALGFRSGTAWAPPMRRLCAAYAPFGRHLGAGWTPPLGHRLGAGPMGCGDPTGRGDGGEPVDFGDHALCVAEALTIPFSME